MIRARATSKSKFYTSWLFRLVFVAGILSLMFMGALGAAPVARADAPGGDVTDPFVRLVDIAKPAVVRIITVINGHLTVDFPNGKAVTFPQNDPNGYQLGLSGTGTFISAHGDILTADHVVNPPHDASLDQYLQQTAAPDVANYYDTSVNPGAPLSPDQVATDLADGQLQSTTSYGTPSSQVFLSTDYTGPLNATSAQDLPAYAHAPVDRIEAQSNFNDRDTAIIHVSNMNDMPLVAIGDSTTVQEQDQLRIIGFPGNGDVNMNNISQLLTSSINQIFVSSIKTTDTGAPVIQVSGNVEHGDSGGPALNSSGQIVGIVSFGTGTDGSTSFLQASASALMLVQQAGVNTTPGPFEKAWVQAFNDYAATAAGHWHKSQQEFQQIANRYPNFKAIAPYLAYATQQAKNEKTSSTPTTTTGSRQGTTSLTRWIIIGGIVVVLLVVILIVVVVMQRRRGSSAPSQATIPGSWGNTANGSLPAGGTGLPAQGGANIFTPYSSTPAQGGASIPSPYTPAQGGASTPSLYNPTPAPTARPVNPQAPAQGGYVAPPPGTLSPFGAPSGPSWQNPAPPSPAPASPPVSQGLPGNQSWMSPQAASQPNLPGNSFAPSNAANGNVSGPLVAWPCGHMNRPIARFCSVCGEPAPARPIMRQYEQ